MFTAPRPRRGDEGLGREVVDLVGLGGLDDAHQRRKVEQVAVDQLDVVEDAEPLQAVIEHAGVAGAAHDAGHRVAFSEKQLRQIRPVLARHTRDQRSLGRHELVPF
jgi:hypothetical protein